MKNFLFQENMSTVFEKHTRKKKMLVSRYDEYVCKITYTQTTTTKDRFQLVAKKIESNKFQ